jgi:hypothetical protein
MKDTAKNRLKAIESLVGGGCGLDAEWDYAFPEELKKYTRKGLEKQLSLYGKVITDIYILSHGFNSKCCKGKGYEMLKPLIDEYF